MGKPSAITWLLLLLVVLPTGVLAWLGVYAADAFDAAEAARLRSELGDARRTLGSEARQAAEHVEASIEGLLDLYAQELAAAGPDYASSLCILGTALQEAGIQRAEVRLVDARGRALWPAAYVPDDGADASEGGLSRASLLSHLRRAADAAYFGDGGAEAAEAVWLQARDRFRSRSLQMLADVEIARLRGRAGDDGGASAAAALRHVRASWGDLEPQEIQLGRPLVLLRMAAAEHDRDARAALHNFVRSGRADATPLTAEERRRLHALAVSAEAELLATFRGTTPRAAVSGWEPSATYTAEVSHGARLKVRIPRSALIEAVDHRLQAHPVPDVTFSVAARARVPSGGDALERVLGVAHGDSVPVTLPGELAAFVNYEYADWLRVVSQRRLRRTLLYVGVGLLFLLTVLGLGLTRRAMARERAARRLRDEFIANVTHEVRTPLTSVLLHSEMLAAEGVGDERRRAYAGVVAAQGKRLAQLVDDMLDFTALERGTRTLEAVPVDLGAACREAAAPFRVLSEREDVDVECSVRTEPLEAMADSAALARVLANLLGNAWKHGRPARDGTRSRVRLVAFDGADGPTVEVRDNGPGVPPSDRAAIFQRFGRGRGAGRKEGAGIGLSLSRDLARAMGGALEVRDEDGETVFRLRLPPVPELEV